MNAMSASIHIKITPVHTGITATATLSDGSYHVSGVSDSNGDITLIVNQYGDYLLSYDDLRVKSDVSVSIASNVQKNVIAHWSELVVYTVKIDTTNSHSTNCITYQDDATSMTKASSTWDTMPIFSDITPCVFQNGAVNYYLAKDNFTKKADGTDADLTGTDGDVMIEFWKFAYKIWTDNTDLYVSVTNNFEYANSHGYCYDAFSRLTEVI
jgi:hypothetical protein